MNDKMITISLDEYKRLRRRSIKLLRLIDGGVDNWEGYDEALYPGDEIDLDEAIKEAEQMADDLWEAQHHGQN